MKEMKGKREEIEQVTRGHNIVADGWAGAANPHPHPTPYPTPFPKQTHTVFLVISAPGAFEIEIKPCYLEAAISTPYKKRY